MLWACLWKIWWWTPLNYRSGPFCAKPAIFRILWKKLNKILFFNTFVLHRHWDISMFLEESNICPPVIKNGNGKSWFSRNSSAKPQSQYFPAMLDDQRVAMGCAWALCGQATKKMRDDCHCHPLIMILPWYLIYFEVKLRCVLLVISSFSRNW